MPQVFDRETGQEVPNLDPAAAAQGLASGKLALSADKGPVSLIGKSGKAYQFAPEQVANVLAQHPDAYRLPTHEEEIGQTVRREEAAKGLGGSLSEAASSGLNQLAMGVPEAWTEEKETPDEKIAREARESYHSTARLLGGAAGFGGSLLLGGEFFKGAELAGQVAERGILPAVEAAQAGLGRKLAATAANYATQGAVLASPQALTQAVAGDPKKAAETLMWGLGAGAVLGVGAGAVGAAAGAAKSGLGGLLEKGGVSEALDKFASDRTVKAIGGERSQINKLSESRIKDLTDFVHDEGLIKPGMSREEVGEAIHAAHDKYGTQIGDAIKGLDGALEKAKPEAVDAALKPGELGARIREALDSPEMNMPMNADQKKALEMVIESADMLRTKNIGGSDVVSFEDAQNFVSDLRSKWAGSVKKAQNGGGVKGVETVTALDQLKSAAYQVARDALQTTADKVAAAAGNPELAKAMAEGKMAYSKLAELEKWVATRERQEAGNRAIGLTDFIHMGAGGNMGAMVGGALGSLAGPAGMAAGAAVGHAGGAALSLLAKRWMEDRGLVHLSAIAKRAAKEGPEVFGAVLASEGGKRLEASLSTIHETLTRMAQRGLGETPAAGGSDHMFHLLGGTSGLSKDDQYNRLTDRIQTLASNPAALAAATAEHTAPLAAASPELAQAYQAQLTQAVHYLAASMPKPPHPPAPFAPNDWSPSEKEKLSFHDKLEILHNPKRAEVHMERGTLSADHLDSLQQNYPTILSMMRAEIQKHAADHPNMKLPRAERQSVGMLLGQPLDATERPENLRTLQASYQAGPAKPGGGPAPGGGQKMPKGKLKNMPAMGSTFGATQGPSSTGA